MLFASGLMLAGALLVDMLLVNTADACPTCKVALGSHDKGQGDVVSAYMYSILFMMAMPFTLVAAFGGYLYYIVRRARQEAPVKAEDVHEETHV
jgi:hypothetical protein